MLPSASFDSKRFSKLTGLKAESHWERVLPSENAQSGYHVHLNGDIDKTRARIGVDFHCRSTKGRRDQSPPYSETVMSWLGDLVTEPSARAQVTASFEKPYPAWKSRFNLPFKVTMSGHEVVIDGVSLELPANPHRVSSSFILYKKDSLYVAVNSIRPVEFKKFEFSDEVQSINESLKVFLEVSV